MSERRTFEQPVSPPDSQAFSFLDETLEAAEDPSGGRSEGAWEGLDMAPPSEGTGDEDDYEPSGSGGLGLILGVLLTLSGLFLVFTTALAPSLAASFVGTLERVSMTALSLVLAGLLTSGFAVLARRQNAVEKAVQEARRQAERMQPGVDYLVQAQEHHLDRPPASGEELDRVLYVLQRQDQKLNNLTKAIKMYGRPLIEISNQTSEAGHELAQVKKSLDSVGELLENQDSTDELKGLIVASRGITGEEVKRMLLEIRIPSADDIRNEVETLVSGQMDSLRAGLQESTRRVAAGVERLLEQSEAAVDVPFDQIKSELANIASILSTIQRTPAPQAPAHSVPEPHPQSSPAPAVPTVGTGGLTGGLAHSIAGAKKAPGKNVLGAIAKLKQMRN